MGNTSDMNKEEVTVIGKGQDLNENEVLDGWDDCDIEVLTEEETASDMRSSTDSKSTNATCSHTDDYDTDASSLDEFEDAFEYITHDDAPNASENVEHIHAMHVIGTRNHILPPYRIRGETVDLLTTTFHPDSLQGKALRAKYEAAYAKALEEYERDPDPCLDHWELRNATADLRDYRHGLKVVHVRGETAEIPTIFYDVVCDETCPQFQDSMAQQVGRAAVRLKKDWWDDLDLGSLF
ncbi:hypothetical protein CKM354_000488900 [Cercospora kikuchii]|uniref:Uncharacterized protein n=1 Tax=Cercospora kikuchii TaxID=84275 RepID=A0A9P3CKU7_9PEZI|nr:uncharacterized protein CKM354_000488900 [Cercospora kikuchii]GIZ41590.1 hypothetical protein CKM354_000488900 [Cercospora kikuchii]